VTETGIMTGITRGIEIMSAGASTTATDEHEERRPRLLRL
jgi:hypothetical protein